MEAGDERALVPTLGAAATRAVEVALAFTLALAPALEPVGRLRMLALGESETEAPDLDRPTYEPALEDGWGELEPGRARVDILAGERGGRLRRSSTGLAEWREPSERVDADLLGATGVPGVPLAPAEGTASSASRSSATLSCCSWAPVERGESVMAGVASTAVSEGASACCGDPARNIVVGRDKAGELLEPAVSVANAASGVPLLLSSLSESYFSPSPMAASPAASVDRAVMPSPSPRPGREFKLPVSEPVPPRWSPLSSSTPSESSASGDETLSGVLLRRVRDVFCSP